MADESRTPLGPERYQGTILDWKGKFGWIQPTSTISHPLANKRGGKVYLSVADVEEELEGVGALVSFSLYADQTGLGAASVRPGDPTEASGCTSGWGGGGGGWGAAAGGKKGGGAGGKGGYGGKGYGGKGFGGYGGCGGYGGGAEVWGPWGACAGGWTAGAGWGGRGDKANAKDLPDRLHKALNDGVWKAAKQISQPDPEWDQKEMTKRIVKYFYKAGTPAELLQMPWPDAAQQFVENAMQGYSAACGDRPWFFELDLSQALCAGVWEIVRVSGCPPRANYPEMEQVAIAKYEEVMDGILTEKAMWDSVQEIFGEEPVANKVYKVLKQTHEASYNEACQEWRMNDQQRVEMFVGRWMENSMGRAWQAVEGSDMLLTPDSLTRLFSKLLAPFGDEHPFSCVPAALTQNCGRPPSGWPFIRGTSEALYNTWLDPSSAGPPSKKRKGGGNKAWKAHPEQDAVGAILEAEAAAALV
mmetsp:Transcript_63354/g.169208  ORF Transcript_63354/g.169208 Transcript_63354/m.169208 type:complete len:472 (-) Transcript_63354:124-1539(-)|eukprot:CAMPEP_0171179752 /NCGR_PEP_ID=MMETSP0790-20130122/13414_1 /TAXON_ID=2925 /ORGANISM="Alexandrium catenella, Strain OF101" /LENGTH=471 /DNA_ID=CAMNT_0011644685 /DNA_START=52 /DNA_END=1467 /DNA_ORIENTATION=-